MADRVLIITYDDLGVEGIFDISDFEQVEEEKVFARLADLEMPEDNFPDMNALTLRARFNSHRNSKVYGVKLPDLYTDDIIESEWERCVRQQVEKIGIAFFDNDK